MKIKISRREMLEALGGGLGLFGLAGAFAGLSRSDVHAAGLGNYAGPALPQKAKHVIMIYLNGGPSQIDMFDPKPALFKYAGQRPSAVDLRTERVTAGLMPSRDWKRARYRQPWYPGETLILGIGQGYMQTTPLQLAQATALMATRGKWIRPHLAKSIDGALPVDSNPLPDIVLRDAKFWDYGIRGMEQVLHGARGTARKVGDSSVYRIAGKSGTAQVVAIKQGEKYDRNKLQERHRDHALFVAFAPAEDPKIAVAVMVENGESGSGVAAPVVKQVMDAWLLGEDGQLKPEFRPPQPLAEQQSANR